MSKLMARITGGLAAVSLVVTVLTGSATSASAGDARRAIAAGLVGGAVGVMVGAAAARAATPPVVVYEQPAPVYAEPACHLERQPTYDEAGYPAGSRTVRVCD
jgi:hypothetical protein